MRTLKEAINTFDKWVSGNRAKRALASCYEKSKTQEGQLEILDKASKGDTTAADYLFLVYKKITAKVFWKYFLGPAQRFHKKRILTGADEDFASVAYGLLVGSQKGASPFNSFNPKKFSDKADLIKQFGYYYYRYAENNAIQMIRTESLGGISGNVPQDSKISTVGYEDVMDNSIEASDTSFEGAIDEKETLKKFIQILAEKNKKYHYIFVSRLQGKSTTDIAKELKTSDQTIRNYLKKIYTLYKEFTE